jgi:hypothetical protein
VFFSGKATLYPNGKHDGLKRNRLHTGRLCMAAKSFLPLIAD